jgi:hypothetical protein
MTITTACETDKLITVSGGGALGGNARMGGNSGRPRTCEVVRKLHAKDGAMSHQRFRQSRSSI